MTSENLAFEGSDGFPFGLALGHPADEVAAAGGGLLADLGDGHDVDGVVQFPVALAVHPWGGRPTAAGVGRGGAVVGVLQQLGVIPEDQTRV